MSKRNTLNREMTQIEKSVIIGSLLGDGCMGIYGKSVSPRLNIGNSLAQTDWVLQKYNYLRDFCSTEPRINKGKKYSVMYFNTRSYPEFLPIYNSFYSAGKKGVPHNIADLLDPLALAVWFCDDGSLDIHKPTKNNQRKSILQIGKIHTCSFSYSDNELLAKAVNDKFGINCHVQKKSKYFIIYIPQKDMFTISNIMQPFFHPSMYYKLAQDTLASTMYEKTMKSSLRDSQNLQETVREESKNSSAILRLA